MSNEIMQENTPFVECSAFHRGMSVLEASLRNTEDSEAIISGLLKGAAEFYGASRASVVEADWDLGIGVITYEWCKDGVPAQRDMLQCLPMEKFPRWRKALRANKAVVISDLQRLEKVYQHEGMQAFMENERAKADIPLQKGPFANFLLTIAHIQELFQDKGNSPIRTALVTSRNAPAHERAIKTLRKWNVHIDEAFFLGGVSKRDVLSAFGAHIFFDDQHVHADPASEVVPSAVVPYREGDNPQK